MAFKILQSFPMLQTQKNNIASVAILWSKATLLNGDRWHFILQFRQLHCLQ